MINYNKLAKQPLMFKRFTGLSVEEFQNLYKKAENGYNNSEVQRLSNRKRKRGVGAGLILC